MAEYNPTHAGQYLIGVGCGAGVHVPESPFTVNIEVGWSLNASCSVSKVAYYNGV